MKNEPIEEIRSSFDREWLLIAVTKMDEKKTLPLEGQLVAHSPRREEISRMMVERHGDMDLMVYSTDALPPGYRAVF